LKKGKKGQTWFSTRYEETALNEKEKGKEPDKGKLLEKENWALLVSKNRRGKERHRYLPTHGSCPHQGQEGGKRGNGKSFHNMAHNRTVQEQKNGPETGESTTDQRTGKGR